MLALVGILLLFPGILSAKDKTASSASEQLAFGAQMAQRKRPEKGDAKGRTQQSGARQGTHQKAPPGGGSVGMTGSAFGLALKLW